LPEARPEALFGKPRRVRRRQERFGVPRQNIPCWQITSRPGGTPKFAPV